jgi:hypothetical protein
MRQRISDLDQELKDSKENLNKFKLKVAEEYATNAFLKEYVSHHFNSIEQRLDDFNKTFQQFMSKI